MTVAVDLSTPADFAWDKFPGRVLPSEPIPDLAPDLAADVLGEGNTEGDMDRKLREYFEAGTRLVWLIDPRKRVARVYTSPKISTSIEEGQSLDGGEVLPGFSVPLRTLFAKLPPA